MFGWIFQSSKVFSKHTGRTGEDRKTGRREDWKGGRMEGRKERKREDGKMVWEVPSGGDCLNRSSIRICYRTRYSLARSLDSVRSVDSLLFTQLIACYPRA